MNFKRIALSAVLVGAVGAVCLAAEVKNGGFEETYVRDANAPEIQAMKKVGWEFQSPLIWPANWEGTSGASNVHFAVTKSAPHSGKNCILLWGQAGSSGYLTQQVKGLKKGIYKLTFWGKGKGTATLMFAGVHITLNAQMTDKWAEYAGIYRNSAAKEAGLTLQAQKGEVFFDDVSVVQCDVLEAALVEESKEIRKEGKWLAPDAKPDANVYAQNVGEVTRVLPELKKYVEADPIPDNVELIRLLEEKASQLKEVTGTPTVEQASEAQACARVARRLVTELQFEDVEE